MVSVIMNANNINCKQSLPSRAGIIRSLPSRAGQAPFAGQAVFSSAACCSVAKRALRSPTKRFHSPCFLHLSAEITAMSSEVCTVQVSYPNLEGSLPIAAGAADDDEDR